MIDLNSLRTGTTTSKPSTIQAARETFRDRLRHAFDGATNAEIARRIGALSGTVRPYLEGDRLPAPEILLKITLATGVNLHWLLTGEGSRRVETENTFTEAEEKDIQKYARENSLTFDQAVQRLVSTALEIRSKF